MCRLICLHWYCWWHFFPNIDPWITWCLLITRFGPWHRVCIDRFWVLRWSVWAQRDLFWFAEALRGRVWPSIRIMIRINIIRYITKLRNTVISNCNKRPGRMIMTHKIWFAWCTCSELVFGWGCLVWFSTNPTLFPSDFELLFSFDFDIDNASEKDRTSTSLPIHENHFRKMSSGKILIENSW